mmetsp:Transcript_15557/g.54045  ORF Transcript_15557/g.54045 Transcript_15557/m.54045 type:complete len:422 (+) Transcript_15557:392-1657(+)
MTKDGWPVAQPRLSRRPSARMMTPWPSGNSKRSTCGLMLMRFMPFHDSMPAMSISLSKWPMLPTMALFFMRLIISAVMMSLLPVPVMKMSASSMTLSILRTMKPSMHACSAQIGSISVTYTTAPCAFSACAQPLPTSPKPATTQRLPAIMTSVARMMPSGSEWRQPYRLSNFDFVTLSFTLIAVNSRVPSFSIWYRRCTPVVVSSETPTQREAYLDQRSVSPASSRRFRIVSTILNSSFVVEVGSGSVPSLAKAFSALTPSWMSSVMSPPSSTMMSGPMPLPSSSGHAHAFSVHSQYSSSVSPFHANTAALFACAIAAAAWSCVEKMLQEHQRRSAPSAWSVSMSTAVCTVMCSEPAMRAPASGLSANSSRHAIRPGISISASVISLRPKSASEMSATRKSPSAAMVWFGLVGWFRDLEGA